MRRRVTVVSLSVSPCVCVTLFSHAWSNSKVRVRCQYIGNEVVNKRMLETMHKLFVPKLWRVSSYLRMLERWTAPRPLPPPIIKQGRCPIACKVMIVKFESCRVRVGSVPLSGRITHNVASKLSLVAHLPCIQGRGFCTLVPVVYFLAVPS